MTFGEKHVLREEFWGYGTGGGYVTNQTIQILAVEEKTVAQKEDTLSLQEELKQMKDKEKIQLPKFSFCHKI